MENFLGPRDLKSVFEGVAVAVLHHYCTKVGMGFLRANAEEAKVRLKHFVRCFPEFDLKSVRNHWWV